MFVVKVGGGKTIDLENVLTDLASFPAGSFVLVHGGNHEANQLAEQVGHPPRFVTSPSGYTSRVTDQRTLDVLAMAYAGKVNLRIVESLQKKGVNAVGLTGVDGRLLEGKRKDVITIIEGAKRKVLRDDFTGKVERVNDGLLRLLLGAGYTPVVTIPAISTAGEAINVDGDRAAAMVAAAMGAKDLVILSDVPGLLRRFPDPASLIPILPRAGLEEALGFAEGRMKKKVLGAAEALEHGVGRVIFGSANSPAPVRGALDGKGTVIA